MIKSDSFNRNFFHFKHPIFFVDQLKFLQIFSNEISVIPFFAIIIYVPSFNSLEILKKAALKSLLALFLTTAFPTFLLATTAIFFSFVGL